MDEAQHLFIPGSKRRLLKMNLLDFILDLDPEFQNTIDSPQYEYSEKIIQERINSKLSQRNFADAIGINLDHLLDMEECKLNIPVEEYKRVFTIIRDSKDEIYKERMIPEESFKMLAQTQDSLNTFKINDVLNHFTNDYTTFKNHLKPKVRMSQSQDFNLVTSLKSKTDSILLSNELTQPIHTNSTLKNSYIQKESLHIIREDSFLNLKFNADIPAA